MSTSGTKALTGRGASTRAKNRCRTPPSRSARHRGFHQLEPGHLSLRARAAQAAVSALGVGRATPPLAATRGLPSTGAGQPALPMVEGRDAGSFAPMRGRHEARALAANGPRESPDGGDERNELSRPRLDHPDGLDDLARAVGERDRRNGHAGEEDDLDDDVVEIRVVVDTRLPDGVGWARVGERHEPYHPGQPQERQERRAIMSLSRRRVTRARVDSTILLWWRAGRPSGGRSRAPRGHLGSTEGLWFG